MGHYLVERYLPSTPIDDIEAAIERLDRAGANGSGTRHVWSAVITAEETCLSLFEAASAEAVATANRAARFPFDRVVEASIILPRNPRTGTNS